MEEVKNENLEVKRPWQINVLLLLILIGYVTFLPSVFITFDSAMAENFLCRYSTLGGSPISILGSFFKHFSIATMPFFRFSSFFVDISDILSISFFVNKKKFIFLSLISVFCDIVGSIYLYLEGKNTYSGVCLNIFWLYILVSLFYLYLSFSCLKHPFYNQKINKT